MSKFTVTAATSHNLSVNAMEEASRWGQQTADIDHLFLALVVNEQVAGQVLRRLGITLETAREAVAAQHVEQLASLGITAHAPSPGRITFHETEAGQWGPRPLAIIKESVQGKKRGDAAAVLRELIVEPSGLIEAILLRLGTSPEAVRFALYDAESSPAQPQFSWGVEALSGSSESFVPAPLPEVWDMLSDPARMPEWEPSTASIAGLPRAADIGSSWTAHALTQRPDGKPRRVKPSLRSSRVELVAREEHQLIGWRVSWPAAIWSNICHLQIALEDAAGGTQLRTSLTWEHNQHHQRGLSRMLRRLRVPGLLIRPAYRFVLWIQLNQLTRSISRVFR